METTPLRVLVVDDEEDFLAIWRVLLQNDPRIGSVHTANDGSSALRELAKHPIDIVLADAWMPTTGYVLAEQARRTRPLLPVVITSCAEGAQREALAHGAAAYLDKGRTVSADLADLLVNLVVAEGVASAAA